MIGFYMKCNTRMKWVHITNKTFPTVGKFTKIQTDFQLTFNYCGVGEKKVKT